MSITNEMPIPPPDNTRFHSLLGALAIYTMKNVITMITEIMASCPISIPALKANKGFTIFSSCPSKLLKSHPVD